LLNRPYALLSRGRDYVRGEGLGPLLVRSVGGSAAVRLGSMAASFAVGVQLARMLGVTGYGYYGLALSIVTIASIPGELGISRLITREVAASSALGDSADLFAILRWGTRIAGAMSLAVMIVLGVAALFLMRARPVLGICLLAAAPTVPFMILARIEGGALQGLQHIVRGQVPANLIRPVLFSVALMAAYLLRVGIGPAAAAGLSSLTAGAAFIVALVWLKQRLPPAVPPKPQRNGRKWIGSSIALALNQGMFVVQSELTILLIGVIEAPAAVGLFRIASASVNVAAAAMLLVIHVGSPVLARLHAEDDQVRLQRVVTAFAWLQFGGVVLLCLPLLIVPEFLLALVFGPSFVGAAPVLRILAASQLVNALFGPNALLLNMAHLERRVSRAMGVGLGLNLVLVPLLTFEAGIGGAAAALFVSTLCWNVLAWRDARRLLGIETSALLRVPN
jgi:O-antigen/teichoic acid export membrane protein